MFASTGVKGDDLPKDYYIKELLFENSVNTAPLDAIEAFKGKMHFKKPLMNLKFIQNLIKSFLKVNEKKLAMIY